MFFAASSPLLLLSRKTRNSIAIRRSLFREGGYQSGIFVRVTEEIGAKLSNSLLTATLSRALFYANETRARK